MSNRSEFNLTRRRLLRLAGIGGGALAAPGAVLAERQATQIRGSRENGTPPVSSLHHLVRDMIGKDSDGTDLPSSAFRVYFDLYPTRTIKKYGLSKAEWDVFVRFKEDKKPGDELQKEVEKKFPTQAKKDVWNKKFNDFRDEWKKVCDGYTKPFDWCPDHPGGTNCSAASGLPLMYTYPRPQVAEVKWLGRTNYQVRGEGFLPDAVVMVFNHGVSAKPTSTPLRAFTGGWEGTFRCSAFTFDARRPDPTPNSAPLPKGTYDLYVLNKVDSDSATNFVSAQPVALEVR